VRALVTGGAGFIGSNLVDALVERGDDAHVLDDLSNGRRENVHARATLHVGDIREPDAVFDEVRPELVFHLAAQANVRTSVERPDLDAEINVLGTVRVLEAARRHGAQVVFSSTGGRQPLSPYGTSKLCGEEYLATSNRLYGTSHVSLRFGNAYGPRQEPHGEAGVVAIFMGLLEEGGTPTIYGDGRQTRDYVYVGDVVDAVLRAAGRDGGVYNVGTGAETSVLELYDEIQRATGIEREAAHGAERLGELQRSVLDPGAAERDLGWRAQTPLAEGLRATWAWVQKE
jgi:UDP-glucose 4-epimerase